MSLFDGCPRCGGTEIERDEDFCVCSGCGKVWKPRFPWDVTRTN